MRAFQSGTTAGMLVLLLLLPPVTAPAQGDDCAELRRQLAEMDPGAFETAAYAASDALRAQADALERAAIAGGTDSYLQKLAAGPAWNPLRAQADELWNAAHWARGNDRVSGLSCDTLQALVANLGKGGGRAGPARSVPGGGTASLPPTGVATTGAGGFFQKLADKAGTALDLAMGRVGLVAEELGEPWKAITSTLERAELALAAYGFLTNPQSQEATKAFVESVTGTAATSLPVTGPEKLPTATGLSGMFTEATTRLILQYPDILKASIETVSKVMSNPDQASRYQAEFWDTTRAKIVDAFSFGLLSPTPEALGAARDQDQSLDDLRESFAPPDAVSGYLRDGVDRLQAFAVPGEPSPDAQLISPESVSTEVPAEGEVREVDLGGEPGPEAQIVDLDNDGDTDRLYADLSGDGRLDWVEYEDANGSPTVRALDTDEDGDLDLVMEREGQADHFTHAFADTDSDGDFDALLASTKADGTFDQAAWDTNNDGAVDRLTSTYDDGTSAIVLDTNGNRAADNIVLTSPPGASGGASAVTIWATDVDENGHFERVFVGPPDNPRETQYLDVEQKGSPSAMATMWDPRLQTHRSLSVDADRDGTFDMELTDSNADGSYDRKRPVQEPVQLPFADLRGEAIDANWRAQGGWSIARPPQFAAGGSPEGPRTIALPGGATMDLVWVPGGSFMMGSEECEDERPVHRVDLDGFWIGRTEVTVGQWRSVMGSVPMDNALSDDHPVLASWGDAQSFCRKAGLTLPAEAQWEYAARGQNASIYPWGDLWDASLCQNPEDMHGYGAPAPVGRMAGDASWCGALDMAGNVQEWCEDWYGDSFYSTAAARQRNPVNMTAGPQRSRVVRGGDWLGPVTDRIFATGLPFGGGGPPELSSAFQCRSAIRHGCSDDPNLIGLRAARTR
jgi:formylglycine-generating enzyme required for sulfatase activity